MKSRRQLLKRSLDLRCSRLPAYSQNSVVVRPVSHHPLLDKTMDPDHPMTAITCDHPIFFATLTIAGLNNRPLIR